MITQAQFIREFNDRNREQFNDEIFKRDEDEIIAEIEKAILSCQRSQVFTIKVEKFTVVDDYDEIHRILYEYEERMRKDGEANKMNYIPMKDLVCRHSELLYVMSLLLLAGNAMKN